MKYVVILGDGMADTPVDKLGGKTPLQVANKPNIDKLAKNGVVGMVKTVPDNIAPGSDVANLSVLGYDPIKYYTGRSPLEAVSMGINLLDTDVAIRCNLVTLSDETDYNNKTMLDYSSDEISTHEADILIKEVQNQLGNDVFKFYSGISYRHCLVWQNGHINQNLTPPHDISNKKITNYVPKNNLILNLMERSYEILKDHPINKERISKGLHPANSIWLWGEGTRPSIAKFKELYNISGSVVSAVDLIKGIGILSGLTSIDVDGATGNIHTNFTGKMDATLNELKNGKQFVYVHIEAPDECGHRFEIENKVKAIELIDEKVVGPIIDGLESMGTPYRIMILPDHPTPLALGTHTSNPVPFIIYDSTNIKKQVVTSYTEEQAETTGLFIKEGHTLMKNFLES